MRTRRFHGLLVVALATGCLYPKMNDLPDEVENDAGHSVGGGGGHTSQATHQGGANGGNSTSIGTSIVSGTDAFGGAASGGATGSASAFGGLNTTAGSSNSLPGGTTSAGGALIAGGTIAIGSVNTSGGVASGGVAQSGGGATGGEGPVGGTIATGGVVQSGGIAATGGVDTALNTIETTQSGGAPASGGAQSTAATGGSESTGGAKATGGNAATGGTSAVGTTTPTCQERVASDDTGLFVDQVAGVDSGSCGLMATPCRTIQRAITRGAGIKPNVYVAAGTYVEQVTLGSNIRVEGAWQVVGGAWQPICSADANTKVVIKAPSDKDRTVIATNLDGAATLAQLSVTSKESAGASESLYGVFASGASTRLILEDVGVRVTSGGSGAAGVAGDDGTEVSSTSCAAGDGKAGTSNRNYGTGAPIGSFDATGYHPSNGSRGPSGIAGGNGTAPATAPGCIDECGSCPSANSSTCNALPDVCGSAGTSGCAGQPGTGGYGGLGGGSSIGIYVWGATVSIVRGSVTAGDGGTGGLGGNPGNGSAGTYGSAGTAQSCNKCTATSRQESSSSVVWTCSTTALTAPGGSSGGKGGDGGDAGPGGAGAGGYSYAIYRSSGSVVAYEPTATTLISGSAGISNGNGKSGDHGPINI